MLESEMKPIARILLKRYKDGAKTKANVGEFLNAGVISQEEYDCIINGES